MSRLKISSANVNNYFSLRPLLSKDELIAFKSSIDEYTDYLFDDAFREKKEDRRIYHERHKNFIKKESKIAFQVVRG